MDFPRQLFELRKKAGLSQEDLADRVGVTRQAVQKWEAGNSRPDMDNLVALTRTFSVSLDYLVLGAEGADPPAAPVTVVEQHHYHHGYEYRSPIILLGLPLVHIKVGHGLCLARGWVAIGNVATGVFALGGISAGLLSLGGLALGGLALGGLSVGLISLGGLAIGGFAFGGGAIGVYAMGGFAAGTQVAVGDYASAPLAFGRRVQGALTFQLPRQLALAHEALAQASLPGLVKSCVAQLIRLL